MSITSKTTVETICPATIKAPDKEYVLPLPFSYENNSKSVAWKQLASQECSLWGGMIKLSLKVMRYIPAGLNTPNLAILWSEAIKNNAVWLPAALAKSAIQFGVCLWRGYWEYRQNQFCILDHFSLKAILTPSPAKGILWAILSSMVFLSKEEILKHIYISMHP